MRRVVAVVVGVSFVLAGCGGTPSSSPKPPVSPTPSVAPAPAVPVMPDAAKVNSSAGSIAFVRYYVSLINLAAATGHFEELSAVSSIKCATCNSFRSNVSQMYRAGGYIRGGQFRVTGVSIPKGGVYKSGRTIDVRVRFDAQTARASSKSTAKRYPANTNILTFLLQFTDRWTVTNWSSAR